MSDFVELRSLLIVILRRWWLLVALSLAAVVVGYGLSKQQDPVYAAKASLMVGHSIHAANLNRADIQTSQQLAMTYADIARRQPVLQGAIDALGLDISWQQLRSRVRVGLVGETQLLEITVEAGSPEEARLIADEVAKQLILLSPAGIKSQEREAVRNFVLQRLENLQSKIEIGQQRIDTLETRLLGELTVSETRDLENQIITLDRLISEWEGNYAQLLQTVEKQEAVNNLTVVEPAQATSSPVRPRVGLNMMIAGLLGLCLALGLVVVLELLDNTIKTTDELSRTLGLAPLGAIHQIKGKDLQDLLLVNHDSFSPASEDYRLLRSKLQFMPTERSCRVIMVTSPMVGDGKSITVANLGFVMAQAGLKTIIVDANLRQPVQQHIFQLPNEGGLTHLLTYVLRGPEQDFRTYLSNTLIPNLKVLVSGALPMNPSELLGSRRMGQLLDGLSELADVILIDTPQAVTVADAAVLANRVDGVLLVVAAGQTRRDVARQAVVNLQDTQANMLGAVLNKISTKNRLALFARFERTAADPLVEPAQHPAYAKPHIG